MMRAMVSACRPKQWMKNLLVVAVPLAAGKLFDDGVLWRTALALAVFVLGSSSIYVINDLRDVEEDRRHPVKARRPIASGALGVGRARVLAAVTMLFALGLPVVFGAWELLWVIGAYVVLQIAYQVRLKRMVLLDLAVVAAGFVLRAVAGGAAADIPASVWFLTVTASSAMFIVAAKRSSEMASQGNDGSTRSTLTRYSPSYVRMIWSSSMVASIVFYALWAVEIGSTRSDSFAVASTVPFALMMLRYAHHADIGNAEAPEDVALHDRWLQVMALVWVALFAAQIP
jgi:decaprenyl-phosphate phosphoribosyltransferase